MSDRRRGSGGCGRGAVCLWDTHPQYERIAGMAAAVCTHTRRRTFATCPIYRYVPTVLRTTGIYGKRAPVIYRYCYSNGIRSIAKRDPV